MPIVVGKAVSVVSGGSEGGLLAEGSRFGAYVIGPCVGHGGMARIYRAEHQALRRQVALKVLTEGVQPGTEGRARFLREARIAAAIKHPNVVNIFDVGVEAGIPYLVMELLVGQDLEALLTAHGPLGESTVIDLIVPVVAGLVAVHDAGVVHRDLKPANIFLAKGVGEEVEPKLLDFGISQVAGIKDMELASTRELLMGTPLYMSPEALLGQDMTPASDQYSLGVLLYECTTGVNPFTADTVAETVRRVTTGQFAPISQQPVRPTPRLQAIIERAMRLEARERFPDMRSLGQELLHLAGQRTRVTWALTFGNAAAMVPARHAPELEDNEVIALTRPRAVRRSGPLWPWAVGSISMAAAIAIVSTRHQQTAVAVPAPSVSRALERAPAAFDHPSSAPLPGSTVERVTRLPTRAASAPTSGRVEGDGAVRRDLDESGDVTGPREPAGEGRVSSASSETQGRAAQDPKPEMVAPPAVSSETPEWIIERSPSSRSMQPGSPSSNPNSKVERGARTGSKLFQVGTNDAPIFD